VRHIDVFVLPWRKDNAFVSYGSAIKVREYMATGKPVVMVPLYEYQKAPGVRFYQTANDFIAAVEDLLRNDTSADREIRQAFVKNCTWDVRTQEVGRLIASLLKNRHSPPRNWLGSTAFRFNPSVKYFDMRELIR
jgi:hypothetical protein